MDLPAGLDKQIGPFPVAGWLAIGGAGVGIGLLVKRSGFLDSFNVDASADLEGEGVAATGAGLPLWTTGRPVTGGGGVALPQGFNPVEVPTGDLTNEQWLTNAVRYLVAKGVDALLADTALRKYLRGDPLTTQESTAVKTAIGELGTPPEGAAPAQVIPDKPTGGVPPNKPPPGIRPPVGHAPLVGGRRVQSNGKVSAGILARFVYRGDNYWTRIRDANPGLVTSKWGRIPKGKWIILP